MKIFANKNIFKKIILTFVLLLSFSFLIPKPVQAGIGGTLMEPICSFLIGAGDGVVAIVHNVALNQEQTMIRIDLNTGLIGALRIAACICAFLAATAVVVLVTGGIGVIGAALGGAELAGAFGAAIAKSAGTVLVLSIATGGWAAIKVSDTWYNNEANLPLYSITPEEIFKNNKELPLFDVNFFEPNEGVVNYSFNITKVPEKIKKAKYTTVISNASSNDIDNKMKSDKKIKMTSSEFIRNAIVDVVSTVQYVGDTVASQGVKDYYRQIGKNVYKLTLDESTHTYTVSYTKGNIDEAHSGELHSFSHMISGIVSTWYNGIRIIAIVGMMSVLVYIGIRILISSTSTQKAKYKQLLGDWFIGMILLFSMHYIMIFSNKFVSSLTDFLNNIEPNVFARAVVDKDGKISEELTKAGFNVVSVSSKEDAKKQNTASTAYVAKYTDDGVDYIEWDTNLMGMIRMEAQSQKEEDLDKYLGYTIMFLVMVFYLVFFTWTYIKRLIYMAFLTIISPLVALTYPIDKANDGKAQGFDYWFKEYIFNLLLQPMHLLIYTILVSMSIELAGTNWIYSLVALGFIASAEKIVRTMFNFSKANTPGVFAGPAGAALTMTGMRWLFGHGPKGGRLGGNDKSTIKDADGESYTSLKESPNIDTLSLLASSGMEETETGRTTAGETTARETTAGETTAGETTAREITAGGTTAREITAGGTTARETTAGETEAEELAEEPQTTSEEREGFFRRQARRIKGTRAYSALGDVRNAYISGLQKKLTRSIKNAKPIDALGRGISGVALGTTLGAIGLSAGIASGDVKNTFQYGGAALAGGSKLGSNAYKAARSTLQVDGLDETYERAYYGENEYKRRKAKEYNDKLANEEATIIKYQKAFTENGKNISREKARQYAQEDSKDYGLPYGMGVDDWIAVRKMQDKEVKVVDKNNKTKSISGRKYSQDEAVAAWKLHKTVGFEGKKEDDIKKLIRTNFEKVNVENAYQTIKTYHETLK